MNKQVISSTMRFSAAEVLRFDKTERTRVAKNIISREIGSFISKDFDNLPIELEYRMEKSICGAEEYLARILIVKREYLKELEEKAANWDMIQWAIDNKIEFVVGKSDYFLVDKNDINRLEKLYKECVEDGR